MAAGLVGSVGRNVMKLIRFAPGAFPLGWSVTGMAPGQNGWTMRYRRRGKL